LLAWPATAFFGVALAYLSAAPGLLGKRHDGSFKSTHLLILLPYFVAVWGKWWLKNRLTSETVWNEVVPGLYVGRWPAAGQVPKSAQLVVDLAAEFPRAASIGNARQYVSLPTLDYETPAVADLVSVAARVAQARANTYVHCAMGHGRSAFVVAAILLRRGVARDAAEALSLLKAARPAIALSRSQRALLQQLEPLR